MEYWGMLLGKSMMAWIAGVCIMDIVGIQHTAFNLVLLAVAGLAISVFAEMHTDTEYRKESD